MTFAKQLKSELCEIGRMPLHCRRALLYGLLSSCREVWSAQPCYRTTLEGAALLTQRLLRELFGKKTELQPLRRGPAAHWLIPLPAEEFGPILDELLVGDPLNRDVIHNECCLRTFFRGVFITSGSMSDPERGYYIDMTLPTPAYRDRLVELLSQQGVEMKKSTRSGNPVTYTKESSTIEDLLTLTGAAKYTLELINVKIYKELRNNANRAANCEAANIDKQVAAAAKQCEDIRFLGEKVGLEGLPPQLEAVAHLRLAHPELSLTELAAIADFPISKSGLCHRLSKLTAMAEELRQQQSR
ncbi:MAG: DNA-binding protein WhiA [Oscillospiraceae bacterium]|nr:DNA-binding protein WhiA [Oscillospiraceae bacterium]